MKKLIVIAVLAICSAAFADLKVGTVDMMKLVRSHKSYDSNKKLLQETEKDYQKDLDRMRAEIDALQDEGKKISEQAKNPMLAQSAKDKAEKDLLDIQNRFIAAQQKLRAEAMKSQEKLQDLETRLLKLATDDIRETITAFAEKNGYDIIVESTVTAFAKKSLNVTEDILKAMKEKETNEGK